MPFLLLVLTGLGLFWCTSLAAAASVTLAWDASAAPELAGYKLYYGYASRSYRLSVNVGQATTAALSGLDEAKVYYLAVVAYDAHGNESDFSNEVIYDLETVDTDGDGLNDWDEIEFLQDRSEQGRYGDGDGIDDGVEINEDHTNPNVADTPPATPRAGGGECRRLTIHSGRWHHLSGRHPLQWRQHISDHRHHCRHH